MSAGMVILKVAVSMEVVELTSQQAGLVSDCFGGVMISETRKVSSLESAPALLTVSVVGLPAVTTEGNLKLLMACTTGVATPRIAIAREIGECMAAEKRK